MNLIKYEGKLVRIMSTNGDMFEGTVGDYCYPEDDGSNLEMIVVDVTKGKYVGQPVGFYEKDIKSIEIIS